MAFPVACRHNSVLRPSHEHGDAYANRDRGVTPRPHVSAAEKRERKRLRSQRRLEKMLALMDKPGAERIFPDVEGRNIPELGRAEDATRHAARQS
jgi:hypothetical protein